MTSAGSGVAVTGAVLRRDTGVFVFIGRILRWAGKWAARHGESKVRLICGDESRLRLELPYRASWAGRECVHPRGL